MSVKIKKCEKPFSDASYRSGTDPVFKFSKMDRIRAVLIYKILQPQIFIPTLLRSKFTQKDDVDLPGGRKEPHRPAV